MCLTPIRIKGKKEIDGMLRMQGHAIVPCGKCIKCKEKRANAWVFRLQKQEKIHKNALFVTLTYAPEHTRMTPKKFMTLCKRDVQLFLKRLRKNTGIKTIKYYAAGEYGDDTWRPHYHLIMYDCTHDQIDKAWGLGNIYVGTVTGDSIAYTTKYICKEKRVPAHQNDDRVPEFSLMSKNMGLNYLTKQMTNWHIENQASFVIQESGYKQPLPRYFRDKIFSEEQRVQLNDIAQLRHRKDFHEQVKHAGSVKEYYRIRFDLNSQIIHNNNNTTKKRNKI